MKKYTLKSVSEFKLKIMLKRFKSRGTCFPLNCTSAVIMFNNAVSDQDHSCFLTEYSSNNLR